MNGPVLELRDVSFSYRGVPVLEDINLSLEGGEFMGLIGPNGAGKTALLKIILGLLQPDCGTVRVFGRTPHQARKQIAYMPQFALFDPEFPIRVRDVVLMGRLGHSGPFRRFGVEDRSRAMEALAAVDLADLADRQIGKLSGGQLQRVLIARALAEDASLLLLDEPTASLDTRGGIELYDLLSRFSKDRTVILVSHDIGVIQRHVTSVACLNRRLDFHGTSQITQEMIESMYGPAADVLAHPHTHRFLDEHHHEEGP